LRGADATAEDLRARIRAGEVGLANELVRIENLADRAERRLAGLDEQGKQKPATQALADFIATVAEQEGEAVFRVDRYRARSASSISKPNCTLRNVRHALQLSGLLNHRAKSEGLRQTARMFIGFMTTRVSAISKYPGTLQLADEGLVQQSFRPSKRWRERPLAPEGFTTGRPLFGAPGYQPSRRCTRSIFITFIGRWRGWAKNCRRRSRTDFANLSPTSQYSYRLALKPILGVHGHRLVRDLPKIAARHIIEEIGATRPGMANLTRAVLSKVMAYAIETGVRADNPFAGLKPYRLGTYHTWTDAEIAQFERCWPLGTRERLAFALLLYTGQRGGDVVKMLRSDIVGGRIRVAQDKARKGTTNELLIPIHPALARALQAGPVVGMQHIITDARGRPLRSLTELIEKAVKKAGLPAQCVAHGLRKAALRRLAERGGTTKEIAAVSGHRSLSEIERYTARADQVRLADSAISKLSDTE
jgi:integrase